MVKPATSKKMASKTSTKQVKSVRTRTQRAEKSSDFSKEAGGTTTREKTSRRRQIDPTTCERDYSSEELQFMNALSEYKRSSGRMFPTCSEILEVIKSLGYVRIDHAETEAVQQSGPYAFRTED